MFLQSHQGKQKSWDISSHSVVAPSIFITISNLPLKKVLRGDIEKKRQPGQNYDHLV